jgi:hypothetical protein
MKRRTLLLIAAAVALGATCASAQQAEPTYKGDPSVYKLIYEDANFRVIEAVRPKGVHDKVHSHPSPAIQYALTDCKTKTYGADGKTSESERKAGSVSAVPVIAAHSAQNTGTSDCRQIFVERK